MAIIITLILIYNVFLNFRIREVEEELNYKIEELQITIEENNLKVYNKMMQWRKEIKNEKPRRRSTKSSSKVSKA
jgi:hypothetical protein